MIEICQDDEYLLSLLQMQLLVSPQRTLLLERLLAITAYKRPLRGMYYHVVLKLALVCKCFSTFAAHMGFQLLVDVLLVSFAVAL